MYFYEANEKCGHQLLHAKSSYMPEPSPSCKMNYPSTDCKKSVKKGIKEAFREISQENRQFSSKIADS